VDVTDVLRDRMQEPRGLRFTAAVSLVLHAALAAALVFGSMRWLPHSADELKPVMTISLGGAGTGPQAGGLTSIGARPVQTTAPAEKREALRSPAAAVPAMTVPVAKAPPTKAAKAPAKAVETVAPTPDARGKTLARGDELRAGTAVADTGSRGQGFGLSTGGAAGAGATLDVADFCCPDYVVLLNNRIFSNWNRQAEVPGLVVIKFTILRDGTLTAVSVEQGSGYQALDFNARRAVELTRQLTPLPDGYPNPTLTVHLKFPYQR
jgi:TonB family protein